jgi:hypothetical protein
MQACRRLEGGQGLFLFADVSSLLNTFDHLTLRFESGRQNIIARMID